MFFPFLHPSTCFGQNLWLVPQELHGTVKVHMLEWWILGVNWNRYQSWSGTQLFSSISPPSLSGSCHTEKYCISAWLHLWLLVKTFLAGRCLESGTNCIALPEVLQLKSQHFIWIQVTSSIPNMHVWHHLLLPNSKAFNRGFLRYLGISFFVFCSPPCSYCR